MRIVPGTWAFERYNPSAVFDKVSVMGFKATEISDGFIKFYGLNDDELRKLKRDLTDRGLDTSYLTCARLGRFFFKGEVPKEAERALRATEILESEGLNITVMRGDEHYRGWMATDKQYEIAASAIRKLCDVASKIGKKICVELHELGLTDTAEGTLKLIGLVDRPNFGANPDLGNWYMWYPEYKPPKPEYGPLRPPETMEEVLDKLGKYTFYWHVKNLKKLITKTTPWETLNFLYNIEVPLPYGDIDHRVAVSKMVELGFDGDIAIEIPEWPGDMFVPLAIGKQYLEEILRELGKSM